MSSRKDSLPIDPASAQTISTLDALDPLFQHRTRLGALVLLSSSQSVPFARLRTLLGETDGNLGAQLRKLEDAGYLTATKAFVDRKPITHYAITPTGHAALKKHLAAMASLIEASNSSASAVNEPDVQS